MDDDNLTVAIKYLLYFNNVWMIQTIEDLNFIDYIL